MSTLGTRIRKMRMRRGYELDKLAYLTGMDSELLARLESDEKIELSIEDVILLAKTLDADLDYILIGDQKSEDETDDNQEIEIDEHSFLKQIINDEIMEYMGHYPITFWANLFRKMCRKEISPDGMCRLIDAVETVKPSDDSSNGNRSRQR